MTLKALLTALFLLPAGMIMADSYNGTETPSYAVALSDGAFELRDYAPRLVAEVTVNGSRSGAANEGFRILAGYIFGGNEGAAKIAMTTPVTEAPQPEQIAMTTPVAEAATAGGWVIQFSMPSGYDLASLPKAKDPRIRFVEVLGSRQAVLRFSGLAGSGALASQTQALQDWMAAQGLKPAAGPVYFFYDPPWTLPWNRRNEVAFALQ